MSWAIQPRTRQIRSTVAGAAGFGATAATQNVPPAGSNYSGTGFYVLGPDASNKLYLDQTGDKDPLIVNNPQNPNFPVTYATTSMTYALKPATANETAPAPMVLLRRLVYPNQLPNPATAGGAYDSTKPYNPYITVDYLDPVQSTDAHVFNSNAGNAGKLNPNFKPLASRATLGRRQPYDAATQVAMSYTAAPNPAPNPPQPANSFGRHNYDDPNSTTGPTTGMTSQTLTIPFNWLPHLDRQLISPVELLQVSAHKPHELTHTFIQGTTAYSQAAPWTNEQARLYRFLEMVDTQSRLPGVYVNGRVPGKVNINTLWDPDVFLAVCDAQASNSFYGGSTTPDANVQNVFTAMIQSRSPSLGNGVNAPQISQGDKPFKSFGIGAAPGGDALDPGFPSGAAATLRGINDTLLRSNAGQPLFVPNVAGVTHPYQQNELLTKAYNNLTTHSNTFAVFLTVGFFEVTDETTRPVKLGAEIGAADGKYIRHRMFAIVDRTNLEVFGTPVTTAVKLDTPTAVLIRMNSSWTRERSSALTGTNPNTNRTWQIQVGSVLVIDPNTANEETVTVYGKATPGIFAQFLRPHAQGRLGHQSRQSRAVVKLQSAKRYERGAVLRGH